MRHTDAWCAPPPASRGGIAHSVRGKFSFRSPKSVLIAAVLLVGLTARAGWPCACGCGVFEVGTPSLLPNGAGGQAWFEYNFQDQYRNWSGTSRAPSSQNDDKRLRTNFFNLGAQYMFDRDWGVMLTVPWLQRDFKSADEDTGEIGRFSWDSIGDIRLWGMYTGFSEDMSTGVMLGAKVPSGWFSFPNADRDTQIGTGSTDFLLGGYHVGDIPGMSINKRPIGWYTQVDFDIPVFTQDDYRPGWEFNSALGTFYDFGVFGFLDETAPFLTLKGSYRASDSGANSDPENTGYGRMLIAPGFEFRVGPVRVYADVEFPIFIDAKGNQIISPVGVSSVVSYSF